MIHFSGNRFICLFSSYFTRQLTILHVFFTHFSLVSPSVELCEQKVTKPRRGDGL